MSSFGEVGREQKATENVRSGGARLVECLMAQGVDTAFGVPGESYLVVLDALYEHQEQIRFITCRQEGGAAYMAEAYGKLTGRPGICFVTRGPGATNAAIGVHTAMQDSTPMVLFVGQVPLADRDREAFQEVNYRAMFGPLAKWVAEIEDATRIPEYVNRAFHIARSGRPGPVVLALPEDILSADVTAGPARPVPPVHAAPRAEDLDQLSGLLQAAERPLVVLGGGGWTENAREHLALFLRNHDLPVAVAFRRQDLFDNDHDGYVGDLGFSPQPRLAAALQDADLVLAIGTRLGEVMSQGYTAFRRPGQTLIHVHAAAEEIGKVHAPELGIVSDMESFAMALAARPVHKSSLWGQWRQSLRDGFVAWSIPEKAVGRVNMAEIVTWLRDQLPTDAIFTNGAGNYAIWAHRYSRFSGQRRQLAPTSGAMGYGVPAAIAAKAACPERTVVAFAGDGCFLMNGQELATAVQFGLNVIIIIVNNGMYGTIRMHQERRYPGRVSATTLQNPDFTRLAEAYGAFARRVTATGDFPAAFEAACNAGRPAVIEICLDPEDLTPAQSLSAIRAAAEAARK